MKTLLEPYPVFGRINDIPDITYDMPVTVMSSPKSSPPMLAEECSLEFRKLAQGTVFQIYLISKKSEL